MTDYSQLDTTYSGNSWGVVAYVTPNQATFYFAANYSATVSGTIAVGSSVNVAIAEPSGTLNEPFTIAQINASSFVAAGGFPTLGWGYYVFSLNALTYQQTIFYGPTIALAHDTGASSTDGITNDPALTGAADANTTLTLTEGSTTLGTTTADSNGNWSFTPHGLTDGAHGISVTETGGPSGSPITRSVTFTLDTASPALTAALAHDTGASAIDGITSDPALTGTGVAGDVITLSEGQTTLGTTTVGGTGAWRFSPTGLADGAQQITTTETDIAGNTSTASVAFTLDIPSLSIALANDTGFSPTDGITSDPTVTGTSTADATIVLSAGQTTLGTVTADSTGIWSFSPTGLANGTQQITATETDLAGNTSTASVAVTLDVPPLSVALTNDTGASGTDRITRDPTITGTSAAGALILVTEGPITFGTTSADDTGAWSFSLTGLTDGIHQITATETDLNGNTATATTTFGLQIAQPASPVLTAPSGAGRLNFAAPVLTGTGPANAAITLTLDGSVAGTGYANAEGAWSIPLTGTVAAGSHPLSLTATDLAGNVSTAATATLLSGNGTLQLVFTAGSGAQTADTYDTGGKRTGTVVTSPPDTDGRRSVRYYDPSGGLNKTDTVNGAGQVIENSAQGTTTFFGYTPSGTVSLNVVGQSGSNAFLGATLSALGNGTQVVTGADGASLVTLLAGDNSVSLQGNDTVMAGSGEDTVAANDRSVSVTGGAGHLHFLGGAGQSTVSGGTGSATVYGGTGGGVFTGGAAGDNLLVAGGGNTTLRGGGDHDQLFGSSNGTDQFWAGSGAETLIGGGGTDTLGGGGGQAVLFAGSGDTTLFGGTTGQTTLVGGAGNSLIMTTAGDGAFGGSGTSTIFGSTGGNNVLGGGTGSSTLVGGAGNTTFLGNSGASTVFGGAGNDTIYTGSGTMAAIEGAGTDTVVLQSGNTTLWGGTGTDTYVVDNGAAGGSAVINDFKVGQDVVGAFGYAASTVQTSVNGGSTTLTFSDGTHIVLTGVTNIGASLFIG